MLLADKKTPVKTTRNNLRDTSPFARILRHVAPLGPIAGYDTSRTTSQARDLTGKSSPTSRTVVAATEYRRVGDSTRTRGESVPPFRLRASSTLHLPQGIDHQSSRPYTS